MNNFGFPLSPAPSPVPSIRQLRLGSPRPEAPSVDDREKEIIERFSTLSADSKSRVLKQLLSSAPRDALLDAQSVISPRLRHDPFKVLPLEVSLRILSWIRDPKSLAAAAQVSRLWYFLLSDDSTWKQLCKDHHFRRLSAAGSYVHRWNRFRERAGSQAIEETPEAEEVIGSSQETNTMQSEPCESENSQRPTGTHSGPEYLRNHEGVILRNPFSQSQRESQTIQASQSAQASQPAQQSEELTQYPQSSISRRNDPRRNSLLGSQSNFIMQVRNANISAEPLMQYGSRLPNFDHEMHRHLANTADPAGDPIGEAYYDPEACVTSPPDSYRSHFRQQYLLNQAWAQGGRLAGRYSLPDHEGAIVTTVLMQDGFIVVALDTSLILVFSDDGKLLRSLYGHVMGVWALALKDHTLLSGGCDRDVREWDLRTGACRKILRGHSSTVRCLAMASSEVALSGGRDAVIRVWDLKDGKSVYRLVGHTGSVRRLEVTNVDDTDYAVSASYDCTAKVWNIENGTLVHTLAGHNNQIYSLAVNNGRIATGSLDHSICVWDLRTGAKMATLLGHSALVGQLALRDNVLVSGGSDGAVRIWDLDKMVCAHRIAAHDNTVTCLRLIEDRIITGGPDCRVQMWNVRNKEHIRQFYKPSVTTVWGVAAREDRLLTVYSEGASIVIELMSFAPT